MRWKWKKKIEKGERNETKKRRRNKMKKDDECNKKIAF